jgi:gluconate kinase
MIEDRNKARQANDQEKEAQLHRAIRKAAKKDKTNWLKEQLHNSAQALTARDKWAWIKRLKKPYSGKSIALKNKAGQVVNTFSQAETFAEYLSGSHWCPPPHPYTGSTLPIHDPSPVSMHPITLTELHNSAQALTARDKWAWIKRLKKPYSGKSIALKNKAGQVVNTFSQAETFAEYLSGSHWCTPPHPYTGSTLPIHDPSPVSMHPITLTELHNSAQALTARDKWAWIKRLKKPYSGKSIALKNKAGQVVNTFSQAETFAEYLSGSHWCPPPHPYTGSTLPIHDPSPVSMHPITLTELHNSAQALTARDKWAWIKRLKKPYSGKSIALKNKAGQVVNTFSQAETFAEYLSGSHWCTPPHPYTGSTLLPSSQPCPSPPHTNHG